MKLRAIFSFGGMSLAGRAGAERKLASLFADALHGSAWASLWFVTAGFALYLMGIGEIYLPISKVIENLAQSSGELSQQLPAFSSWKWLFRPLQADLLSLTGLSLLSMAMWTPYLLLIIFFFRQGDRLYLLLALIQLGIFSFASFGSGVLF